MTKDNEDALRCADDLEGKRVYDDSIEWAETLEQSAAHLRRLVAENRATQAELLAAQDRADRLSKCAAMLRFGLKEAADAGFPQAKSMRASYLGQDAAEVLAYESALEAKDALLRQAVEALTRGTGWMTYPNLIAAIRQHLESKP